MQMVQLALVRRNCSIKVPFPNLTSCPVPFQILRLLALQAPYPFAFDALTLLDFTLLLIMM